MAHPLVDQLRFTRREWLRALAGVSDEDARRQLPPMNCISWIVGHMAWHEQRCWIERVQGATLVPGLDEIVGSGRPATAPPLADMWEAWQAITKASDPYLDSLTTATLQAPPPHQAGRAVTGQARPRPQTHGSLLLRVTYHYWYHIGEALAIRQMLGHRDLPEFVGDLHLEAPYRPE